jgi:predicted MFS family arabinose efflux permease
VRTKTSSFSLLKAFRNVKTAYLDVDTRPLYTVSFLMMLGFAVYTSFSAVFLTDRLGFSEAQTGTYFAFVGFCMVVSQVVIVRYAAARYTERYIIGMSLPVLALTLICQMFVMNPVMLYALVPFTAATVGLITTNLPALISKGVSASRQGAALGINGSLQALSQGIAPLCASAVAAVFGIPFIFVLASLLVVGATLLLPKRQG